MLKETNKKIVKVLEMKEREELFKNEEYVVIMLKERLCMLEIEMGRVGFPNMHIFSPPF